MAVPRLLIVTALGMESAPLRRMGWASLPIRLVRQWPLERWRIAPGEIGAIATGVGGEVCRRALTAVDAAWRPDAVITAGIAGATERALQIGDVCLAETVMEGGQRDLVPHPSTLEQVRETLSGLTDLNLHLGNSLTVDQVVPTCEAKRLLARQTGCHWIDMESAPAARMAQRFALPWISIRAVSDSLDDDLNSTLDIIDSKGRIPLLSLARAAMTPRRARATLRLRRNALIACNQLCAALAAIVPDLLAALPTARHTR